jgi:hypothetical protein
MKANVLFQVTVVALALSMVAGSNPAEGKGQQLAAESSTKQSAASPKEAGAATDKVEIELIGATPSAGAETEVIEALKKLLQGIAHADAEQIASCLSNDVTTFDTHTDKFIHSKEAVLAHVKKNVIGTGGVSPIKRLAVYHPFVSVKGETAMVSFKATKELADKQSTKLESWCAEIYEKKNGEWLVLQLKTNWEPAKSKD